MNFLARFLFHLKIILTNISLSIRINHLLSIMITYWTEIQKEERQDEKIF